MDSDVAKAKAWWASLRPSVPVDIAGLWFGLFTTVKDREQVRTLYVVGTATFDPADESGEWAVGPYLWEPEGRYIVLPSWRGYRISHSPLLWTTSPLCCARLNPGPTLRALAWPSVTTTVTWWCCMTHRRRV